MLMLLLIQHCPLVIGSIANTSFAATQSGTWNVTNISGTVSLPTGAATETTVAGLLTNTQLRASAVETTKKHHLLVTLQQTRQPQLKAAQAFCGVL